MAQDIKKQKVKAKAKPKAKQTKKIEKIVSTGVTSEKINGIEINKTSLAEKIKEINSRIIDCNLSNNDTECKLSYLYQIQLGMPELPGTKTFSGKDLFNQVKLFIGTLKPIA